MIVMICWKRKSRGVMIQERGRRLKNLEDMSKWKEPEMKLKLSILGQSTRMLTPSISIELPGKI